MKGKKLKIYFPIWSLLNFMTGILIFRILELPIQRPGKAERKKVKLDLDLQKVEFPSNLRVRNS